MEFQYKKKYPVEKRKKQQNLILNQNPNKIPIILEKDPKCRMEPIEKTKFLIKKDFTVNQFSKMVRALMCMPEGEALFFAAKGKYTITGEKPMEQIYKDFKDKEDGFLYIAYTTEIFYG